MKKSKNTKNQFSIFGTNFLCWEWLLEKIRKVAGGIIDEKEFCWPS